MALKPMKNLRTKGHALMVDTEETINFAKVETKLRFGNEGRSLTSRQKLALTCRILFQAGHCENDGLAGQVTMRAEYSGTMAMLTQAFGFGLEETKASDYLLVGRQLEVIEGNEMPNQANRFHLHIYEKRPEINCIIHTHGPYSSLLASLNCKLKVAHMDTIGLYEDIAHLGDWPGVPFGDVEGRIISDALGQCNTILLAHHGLVSLGQSIEQACYRAIVFEKAAEQQVKAMWTGREMPEIDPKKALQAKAWKLSEGPLNARFYYWARRCMPKHEDCLQ